jgi:hypothetical protein
MEAEHKTCSALYKQIQTTALLDTLDREQHGKKLQTQIFLFFYLNTQKNYSEKFIT